mmetsp:Transcript_27370/g.80538  ORF Transcript_27370/g.80538 Transcript_27370/m.80538 type:complete len:238 (-) Transcript_27370:128-841(-)|eukprot:CAMPEP_0113563462 /NCGR_PEP_ID=MMETSP0015_2-20120614/21086_1 /TAXON_ID=2838 /ORGANISM="Odontella" /LENGTH=237 /DNA_ID=CAMNT_0000465453 /DNA_START=73 /DNA_END=786 /DNA_ORIENTATION=+ /assembly_acc=CAM_ASM_000160
MRFYIFTVAAISALKAYTAAGSGVLREANNEDKVARSVGERMLAEHLVHGDLEEVSNVMSADGDHGNLRSPSACFKCDGNNPCLSRDNNVDPFYFPHCDEDKFVQCSKWSTQCFDMPCPAGLKWYQSPMTCCHDQDVQCQEGVDPRIDPAPGGNIPVPGPGVVTCSGYGDCGGTKPCFDHTQWPDWSPGNYPGPDHVSWCSSNEDCESCCCGTWAGIIQVCIDSTGTGSGLLSVCMK